MKALTVIRKVFKTLEFIVLGLLLLVCGTVVSLYSPWLQDTLRVKLVAMLNRSGDARYSIERFRLGFPLSVEVGGLSVVSGSDTIIAADRLEADVALLPLIRGEVDLTTLEADGARYVMGNRDSAMYMTLAAGSLSLSPASVRLSDMAIDVKDGRLADATVAMTIKPDTTAVPAPEKPASQTAMSIRLGHLSLDNLRYSMSLLPTIDSLGATIGHGRLENGLIDLGKQKVAIGTFAGNALSAAYIAPDSATVASIPVVEPADTPPSAPWTVTIDSIAFTGSQALYTTRGVIPAPGLDFAYIQVDSLDLTVNNFYNQASTVKLPLRLSGHERCGVSLTASGRLDIDSTAIALNDFIVSTPVTDLSVSGLLGSGDLMTDPSLSLALKAGGAVGVSDLRMMFPAFMPYLLTLPADNGVELAVDLSGVTSDLDIRRLDVGLNHIVTLKAKGNLTDVFSPARIGGDIALSGSILNGRYIKHTFLGSDSSLEIPQMAVTGRVRANNGTFGGNVKVIAAGGSVALDGQWRSRSEDYKADVDVGQFPVNSIMPLLGVGKVSGKLTASGHGYDPFSPKMSADVRLSLASAEYNGYEYKDIEADATLKDGKADVRLVSTDPSLPVTAQASGNLDGDTYVWTAAVDGEDIDLKSLKFSESDMKVSLSLTADATLTPKDKIVDGRVTLEDLTLERPEGDIVVSDILAHLNANDSLTDLSLNNRDLNARFTAYCGLDSLLTSFGDVSAVVDSQMTRRRIDVEQIHSALPGLVFDLRAGRNNFINDILAASKTGFSHLSLTADNDTTLRLSSEMLGFVSGTTRLDTITFGARQHKEHLHFTGRVDNRPGTFDDFAKVKVDGFATRNIAALRLTQQNIKSKEGFDFGLKAEVGDSVLTVNVIPATPVIGYQTWALNRDNYVSYRFSDKHIDANIDMTGGNSSLKIYTTHVDGSEGQEDLVVSLGNIHLADWIAINPFAPPMTGDLSADIKVNTVDGAYNGSGVVTLDKFTYGRQSVGDIKADFDLTTRPGGTLYAKSDVYIDGEKTITLAGNLNDSTSTSPYNLDFSMIRFPLATVNPFLPPGVATLSGVLNGNMVITGDSDAPVFNGKLDFDDTAVKLALTGTPYKFSDVEIPVINNLVTFDSFKISGVNDNPLTIDGTVDLKSLSAPVLDLKLNANNMQLVNTRRASKGADVYGKAFISLDATVKGGLSLLFVDATLDIEPGTNVTYVIPDAANRLQSQSTDDMVKFVNFTDTTAVAFADSISASDMALVLNAMLNISTGSTISVDLSSDGKDKVQLQSSGTLNFAMSPLSDGRLTGRLNLNEGFVRYTPPFMSEKLFNFYNNSYVAFNGDMMNPTLNIHAMDVMKANVTQQGQNSRLVNFDVIVNVTGTLNTMKVAFDLATNDDVTVANELESMSAEQRANEAMNMMLYGVYTGGNTKGDTKMSANPLFSFLESQLNGWMANNIRGVDISFGINQYDRTVDGASSTATSYSYQVSKSLFNDRIKIVVGGNYSTDANADENFSQNLINDISFEYFLNRSRTMYVRIFRHTGYESILEGEVTQTGVGFVYRRKLRRMSQMFNFLRPKKKKDEPTAVDETVNNEAITDDEKNKVTK